MNRLTALRAFVAAVDHGSFAAAARALGVSAAGVSKNVRELEADLGVRLFHRSTRAMALTDEGALYYERMRVLLAEMDEVDAAVTEVSSRVAGTLRVTAPMSVGLLRLAPLVPIFLAEHPDVSLDLHLDDEKDDLIHGGFDLAIRGTGKLPDSTLIARRLTSLDHVMIASPDYLDAHGTPKAPEDLRDRACLLYANAPQPDRWTLRSAANGAERTVRVRGPLTANNSLVLREAVLADIGIASMPRLYIEEDIAAGRIVPVMEDWTPPALSIWAIYPPGPTVLPRVRLFIDFLARHLRGFEAMTPEAVEVTPDASSQD